MSKSTFFRQGAWMVFATVAGGVGMTAVHSVAGTIKPDNEYNVFVTLLRMLMLWAIPAAGLQTVFAQQTAAAISDERRLVLKGTTRAVLKSTFYWWLAVSVLIMASSGPILRTLKITHPAALWVTLLVCLTSLWQPTFKGLLQGEQNFNGLGWITILDGMGRFAAVCVIVLLCRGQAAGGMTAALAGQVGVIAIGAWLTRHIWRGSGQPFRWRPWLSSVLPLTLGSGAVIFMSYTDILLVQILFTEQQTTFYVAASMSGFALTQMTMPFATVMFPKIVRSAARAERSDALQLTLACTVVLGGLVAAVCTVFPAFPLRIVYFFTPARWAAAPLVPWFVWCMLLLTLANVVVGNLLARERFAAVPWLVLVAVGYGLTLLAVRPWLQELKEAGSIEAIPLILGRYGVLPGAAKLAGSWPLTQSTFIAFRTIILILSAFNLLLLAVAAWFTWQRKTVNFSPAKRTNI